MRLALLTALTMTAFAANSVLNRMALKGGLIDALPFAAIRLVSGALVLAALALVLGRGLPVRAGGRAAGVLSLFVYMLGFSLAYLSLDAGAGALILFGGVQITMFTGALLGRESVPARRWVGVALAFAGLLWLLWPSEAGGIAIMPALSMATAAVGWGVYSMAGRKGGDPLAGTAANFLLAAPLAVLALAVVPDVAAEIPATAAGIGLALVSGIVTSGLGYALWYAILPQLGSTRAAVAQLTVPVIAAGGGLVLLAEPPTPRFLLASVLVLGGVLVATVPMRAGKSA